MESLIRILTAIVALGGLAMVGVLLNMLRIGDYSALVGDGREFDQTSAQTEPQSASNPTRARAKPRAKLRAAQSMEQVPAVTGFAKETADFENEEDRIQTGERFRAIRKRRVSK
jgi:hypothetical protein